MRLGKQSFTYDNHRVPYRFCHICRGKEKRGCRLRPILYLVVEEASDRGIRLYLVGTLTEAMPFVLEAQKWILHSCCTSRAMTP